jgi:hypothetical protein
MCWARSQRAVHAQIQPSNGRCLVACCIRFANAVAPLTDATLQREYESSAFVECAGRIVNTI